MLARKNENKYADIKRNENGTWTVYNNVTGQVDSEGVGVIFARQRLDEIFKYYNGVEHGRN